MKKKKNIFSKKKFLIYGLGKSGISSYFFLKKNNEVYLYDDYQKKIKNKKLKKILLKPGKVNNIKFDYIVISPGIDIKKCLLKKIIKKNLNKIITDLDIFYNCYSKNKNLTITGTNGKSTTAKIIFNILKQDKKDVRLVGNIGNPILSEKKINKKTIFVIEASSYQIEYSKYFKANYGFILNITPDHLERHGNFQNYIKAKFKLVRNQTSKDYSFLDLKNKLIKNEIKKKKLNSKIVNVGINIWKKFNNKLKNDYFLTDGNKQNLSFAFAAVKKLGLKEKKIYKAINNFKGLKFRQEIIFKTKNFTLINDSKATSYSSSINILKSLNSKVYWLVGGVPKIGDKFLLSKRQCINFKAYIFGKNKKFFIREFKKKIKYEHFQNLKEAVKKIILDIKLENDQNIDKILLFSPSAASFDSYKNFEDRGKKFNNLINELNLKKLINARK